MALLGYLIRNRIHKLKNFNNLSVMNIDVFRDKKHEPIIILYLIHSFVLIDLRRNEIKRIICYNDIDKIILGQNNIMVVFKNLIFGVKIFLFYLFFY